MPGGSEFRLHQGFGLRPTLARRKSAAGQKAASAKCCIFFVCICQKAGSRCRGKPAFCIDWVPHTANRASCECSPSREGTPCSDFGRTHLNAPTRSEEPEHFRPQFLLVSPLPAGMDGTQPSIATALGQYSLQYRAIFCSSMMSDRLWPDYRCIFLLRKAGAWHGQSQVCSWEFHFSAQPIWGHRLVVGASKPTAASNPLTTS